MAIKKQDHGKLPIVLMYDDEKAPLHFFHHFLK